MGGELAMFFTVTAEMALDGIQGADEYDNLSHEYLVASIYSRSFGEGEARRQ
jgi:hypothetical protein